MRASGPVWREQSRAPRYPQISHDLKVDVAVVGGGITGFTSALLLARAGKSVALLEGRTIASGVTERSTAQLTESV
jgi:glycerol-3-phosphate dehydrogenase